MKNSAEIILIVYYSINVSLIKFNIITLNKCKEILKLF
jgi:hypothetical protein